MDAVGPFGLLHLLTFLQVKLLHINFFILVICLKVLFPDWRERLLKDQLLVAVFLGLGQTIRYFFSFCFCWARNYYFQIPLSLFLLIHNRLPAVYFIQLLELTLVLVVDFEVSEGFVHRLGCGIVSEHDLLSKAVFLTLLGELYFCSVGIKIVCIFAIK